MKMTPRTDANENVASWPGRWVYADFARDLEKDLMRVEQRNTALAETWDKAAAQYQKMVDEARSKDLPHQGMLAMATCLRGCAKELRGGK